MFNKFRNRINRDLKKSKKDYFSNYFKTYSNDIKKTWLGIKSILNINRTQFPEVNQLLIDDKIIDDPKIIAQKLNDFFVNIGPNTEKKIPINPITKPENFLKTEISSTF